MAKVLTFLKKRWYVIAVIIVIAGYFLYRYQTSIAQTKKLTTYTVKRKTLTDLLALSGQIDADEHVVLRFPVSGKLVWLGAREGDTVKKYQGLASLDARDVQKKMEKTLNDYAKERNAFDQSRQDNQRIGDQSTREAGDTMKRLLENAQYDLTNSVLDVEIQKLAQEYSYLYSPIEGILVRVDAKYTGVNITPATAEFEVVNPKTIYFSATADQTDVIKLKEGMTGSITFDPYPEDTYQGVISQIGYTPKLGETGTVYQVKMKLSDQGTAQKYKLGMTGDAEFPVGEKVNVIVVPSRFVKSEGDKKYVTKLVESRQIKTYIKTGMEVEGDYEVLSGLNEGEKVISTP